MKYFLGKGNYWSQLIYSSSLYCLSKVFICVFINMTSTVLYWIPFNNPLKFSVLLQHCGKRADTCFAVNIFFKKVTLGLLPSGVTSTEKSVVVSAPCQCFAVEHFEFLIGQQLIICAFLLFISAVIMF